MPTDAPIPLPEWLLVGALIRNRLGQEFLVLHVTGETTRLRGTTTGQESNPLTDTVRRDYFPATVPPGTVMASWPAQFIGSWRMGIEIETGEPNVPEGPPEVVQIGLPIAGIVSVNESHPQGVLQRIQNLPPIPGIQVGQRVNVTEGGVSREFTVTETHEHSLTILENRPSLPQWMRVGVRLASRGNGSGGIITGIINGHVHVRDVEAQVPGAPLTLGGMVRAFTAQQVEQLYMPEPVPYPPWLIAGARIVQVYDGANYHVQSVDPIGGVMVAHREDEPTRIQRFNLNEVERHWRPYSSLSEVVVDRTSRRAIARAAPVPSMTIPTPPSWIHNGVLIRTRSRNNRRTFWVASLHPDRGMCRIQRVETLNPFQVENQWEEISFEMADNLWELLDAEGHPVTEQKCPICTAQGTRDQEAEANSPYDVRIYACPKEHRWSFVDGGVNDGDVVALTRFERDFDL